MNSDQKDKVSRILYNLVLIVENNMEPPLAPFESLLRGRLKEAIYELHKPEPE